MEALSAADVFLLPFTDGVSTRRGSFLAVSQLATPLVSTLPERDDEFAASPALKTKIDNPATALRPVDATPEQFADAVLSAHANRDAAVSVDLAATWRDGATAHLAFYDRIAAAR